MSEPTGGAETAAPKATRDAKGRFLKTGVATTAPVRATRTRCPAAARGKRKPPVRWSAKRQALFLASLAETANVALSARAARLSETTVYRRRAQSPDFRALWQAALGEGVVRLETMLLDRALNGVEKPVWHGGKRVGTMREYNDRMALALLAHHRGSTVEARAPQAEIPIEELRARLKTKLSEMNRRMGGAG